MTVNRSFRSPRLATHANEAPSLWTATADLEVCEFLSLIQENYFSFRILDTLVIVFVTDKKTLPVIALSLMQCYLVEKYRLKQRVFQPTSSQKYAWTAMLACAERQERDPLKAISFIKTSFHASEYEGRRERRGRSCWVSRSHKITSRKRMTKLRKCVRWTRRQLYLAVENRIIGVLLWSLPLRSKKDYEHNC